MNPAPKPRTPPVPKLIRTPADAERNACDWVKWLGFDDATVTTTGPDGGIDITSKTCVAQVKAEMVKTGRPALQAIYGIACHEKKQAVFFSLAGYTNKAIEWANSAGVALFKFDLQGAPEAANKSAKELMDRASRAPHR